MGDYRSDKEALGGDQGGEGCCCGTGSGCSGGTQDSAEGSGASKERRSYRSGTKGAVHRNEKTVGEKEKGGPEEGGLAGRSYSGASPNGLVVLSQQPSKRIRTAIRHLDAFSFGWAPHRLHNQRP
jgi:hypothetical protein